MLELERSVARDRECIPRSPMYLVVAATGVKVKSHDAQAIAIGDFKCVHYKFLSSVSSKYSPLLSNNLIPMVMVKSDDT